MTYLIGALALTLSGASITAIALAIRVGGLQKANSELGYQLHTNAKQLMETAGEFRNYKARTMKQLEALRNEIAELEKDLDACSDPATLRNRLERLLQKAAGRDSGENPDDLSIDGW